MVVESKRKSFLLFAPLSNVSCRYFPSTEKVEMLTTESYNVEGELKKMIEEWRRRRGYCSLVEVDEGQQERVKKRRKVLATNLFVGESEKAKTRNVLVVMCLCWSSWLLPYEEDCHIVEGNPPPLNLMCVHTRKKRKGQRKNLEMRGEETMRKDKRVEEALGNRRWRSDQKCERMNGGMNGEARRDKSHREMRKKESNSHHREKRASRG